MVTTEIKGLAGVTELLKNRDKRVRELKREGKKIIGIWSCQVPLEMLTALELVPYRVLGNVNEPPTAADAHLEKIYCPYIRSCFDLALKGKYNFLDGFASPDTCDSIKNIFDIWRPWPDIIKTPNMIMIGTPHLDDPASVKFFREELEVFKQILEKLSGKSLTNTKLAKAIDLHNTNRALLRELYGLRKPDPPLILGSEVVKKITAVQSLPITEANELVKSVIADVKTRKDVPGKKVRLLVDGTVLDGGEFMELVEASGANVVADTACLGSRWFWNDVKKNPDPWDGLTLRYLTGIPCARTVRMMRQGEINYSFRHVYDFVKDFNVGGAILCCMRMCEVEQYDQPDLRDYLKSEAGIPVLSLTNDFTTSSFATLRTRIQAFIEMIEGNQWGDNHQTI